MAKYNGSEGGEIPLKEAAAWTANYRRQTANPKVARAHTFGRDILHKILAQDKCVGIRMYYGIQPVNSADGENVSEEGGTKQLILVGVDEEGNDLEDGVVADRSSICPPECGNDSELDGGG